MTTTVIVRVNGKYRATITQNDLEPVVVEGNYNGGPGERGFGLPHGKQTTFVIDEQPVADGDERPLA